MTTLTVLHVPNLSNFRRDRFSFVF